MPPGAKVAITNTNDCSDTELAELLRDCDAVIHAAGADGRNSFPAPAIDGFRAANVEPVRRLITVMKEVRCGRLVIFGSYYTALDRLFPHLGFMIGNAYPMSRKEQSELAFNLAGHDIHVAVLELPYIFGGAPGRGTLWQFYMDHVLKNELEVPVPGGGSACVTANQVARAAAGACERSQGHRQYPIGGKNLNYIEIYRLFAEAMGLRRNITAKAAPAVVAAETQRAQSATSGIETGYDPVAVANWQEQYLYLDPAPAMEALGFFPDDLSAAIRSTVDATRLHGGQGPASVSKLKS
jgi:nucleoside-diphosphate-sugar epimerase